MDTTEHNRIIMLHLFGERLAMSKIHLFAKVCFIAVGISLLAGFLKYFEFLLVSTIGHFLFSITGGRFLLFVTIFSILFFPSYYLIFKSDRLAEMITGPLSEKEIAVTKIHIVTYFRVMLFFCGIVIIFNSMEFLVQSAIFMLEGPRVVIQSFVQNEFSAISMSFSNWAGLFANLCKVVLGIYLVLGAPHFVRWQLKKSQRCLPSHNSKVEGS